jgi:hypothetical protein
MMCDRRATGRHVRGGFVAGMFLGVGQVRDRRREEAVGAPARVVVCVMQRAAGGSSTAGGGVLFRARGQYKWLACDWWRGSK